MNPESNGTIRSVADVAREIEERRKAREERGRTFELGGEKFMYKPGATMDILADYYDMASGKTEVTNHEAVAIIDQTVLAFLEPGQEKKWAKVRSDKKHPLSVDDAHALIEGLLEVTSARPTLPPSGSTDGRETSGTTSTEDSPSKEETSAA